MSEESLFDQIPCGLYFPGHLPLPGAGTGPDGGGGVEPEDPPWVAERDNPVPPYDGGRPPIPNPTTPGGPIIGGGTTTINPTIYYKCETLGQDCISKVFWSPVDAAAEGYTYTNFDDCNNGCQEPLLTFWKCPQVAPYTCISAQYPDAAAAAADGYNYSDEATCNSFCGPTTPGPFYKCQSGHCVAGDFDTEDEAYRNGYYYSSYGGCTSVCSQNTTFYKCERGVCLPGTFTSESAAASRGYIWRSETECYSVGGCRPETPTARLYWGPFGGKCEGRYFTNPVDAADQGYPYESWQECNDGISPELTRFFRCGVNGTCFSKLFEDSVAAAAEGYTYLTLESCLLSCTISESVGVATEISIAEPSIAQEQMLEALASTEDQKEIWKWKLENSQPSLVYVGTNNLPISHDGKNCPSGMVKRVDGDNCNYCSRTPSERLERRVPLDLGNGVFGHPEGHAGFQGNCSTGFVIELIRPETNTLACTTAGQCNPSNCLGDYGRLLELSLSGSVDDDRSLDQSKFKYYSSKGDLLSKVRDLEIDRIYNYYSSKSVKRFELEQTNTLKDLSDVFSTRIHKGIRDVAYHYNREIYDTTLFGGVDADNVYRSLSKSIRNRLDSMIGISGDKIDPVRISTAIKKKVFRGEIETITSEDLDEFFNDLPKEEFGASYVNNVMLSEEEKVSYFLERALPAHPYDDYYNLNQHKKLENLYIPPTEIFESIPVVTSGGDLEYVSVNNDLTFSIDSEEDTLNYDHTYNVITSSLDTVRVNTSHNLENTLYLLNYDLNKFVSMQTSSTPYRLTVRNEVEDIEYVYDTYTTDYSGYRYLQLIPSSIEVSEDGEFLNIVSAQYYNVSDPSDPTFQEENIRRRMGPWLHINLDFNDPLQEYVDYATTQITLEKRVPTFRKYYNTSGELGEVTIASQIPWFILITVGDRISLNSAQLMSNLDVDGKGRYVDLKFSDRKSLYNPGLTTPLKSKYTIFNDTDRENIQGVVDSQAIEFEFDSGTKVLNTSSNFISDKPQRKNLGHRNFRNFMKRIRDNYELSENSISNFDLFSRMTGDLYFPFGQGIGPNQDEVYKNIQNELGVSLRTIYVKDPVKSKIITLTGTEVPEYTNPIDYPYTPTDTDFIPISNPGETTR